MFNDDFLEARWICPAVICMAKHVVIHYPCYIAYRGYPLYPLQGQQAYSALRTYQAAGFRSRREGLADLPGCKCGVASLDQALFAEPLGGPVSNPAPHRIGLGPQRKSTATRANFSSSRKVLGKPAEVEEPPNLLEVRAE